MGSKLKQAFSAAADKLYQKYLTWYFAPLAQKPVQEPYVMPLSDFLNKSGLASYSTLLAGEGATCLGHVDSVQVIDDEDCTYDTALTAYLTTETIAGRKHIKLRYHKIDKDSHLGMGNRHLCLEAVFENATRDFSNTGGKVVSLFPQAEPRIHIKAIYDVGGLWREHRDYHTLSQVSVMGALHSFQTKLNQLSLYSEQAQRHFSPL